MERDILLRVKILRRPGSLGTIATVGPGDEEALHARVADSAVEVGSYLDADALVAAAGDAGAELVHPGYGFLAESADFAEAVLAGGLVWGGPPPEALRRADTGVMAGPWVPRLAQLGARLGELVETGDSRRDPG